MTNLCFQVHLAFECLKQPNTIPASADILVTHLHPWLYSNSKFYKVNEYKLLQYLKYKVQTFPILWLKISRGLKQSSVEPILITKVLKLLALIKEI
jgi:hypothetical protein